MAACDDMTQDDGEKPIICAISGATLKLPAWIFPEVKRTHDILTGWTEEDIFSMSDGRRSCEHNGSAKAFRAE